MSLPGEMVASEEAESEDTTDDTVSVESYPDTASTGDIGESSDMLSSGPSMPFPYSLLWKSKKDEER